MEMCIYYHYRVFETNKIVELSENEVYIDVWASYIIFYKSLFCNKIIKDGRQCQNHCCEI